MSNTDDNAVKYYDLHTKGAGFLNRAREVKPKPGAGNKFKPFWSVGIGAFRGSSDAIEYTNFDTVISGFNALELIKEYQEKINDQNTSVICGFTIGDTYAYTYNTKNKDTQEEETRAGIKGRLLKIQFLKIDGEMVYKYEKPQSDDEETDAQKLTEKDDLECPFYEQLGNQVYLEQDDPDFDKKKAYLELNAYIWNSEQECYELLVK